MMNKSAPNIKLKSSYFNYGNIIISFMARLKNICNPKKYNNNNYNLNIFSINNNTLQRNKLIKCKHALANKISFFLCYNLTKFPHTFGEFCLNIEFY